MKQTQTTQVAVVLPEEVQAIALSVSEEKRAEVNNTLTQIFAGTSEWKAQVDAIVVADPSDKLGMNLAKTARLNAKNARLAAEKIFDQKRDEVQAQMLSFQTEDKLWLKAKQTMIILFKDIEQAAEYKEKTAERFEAEQRELKIQTRLAKIAPVNPEISRQEIEGMSDDSFDVFLNGLIKAKEAAEKEAAEEAERLRLAELKKQRDDNRFKIFAGTGMIFTGGVFANQKASFDFTELCELSDDDFVASVQKATDVVAECKAEEVKEKERLRILAEQAAKEKAEQEAKAESERKKAAEEKARQDAIIAKQKAELDAKLKAEAEVKSAEAKRIADEKAEAERLAKAPKKEQLTKWIDGIVVCIPVGLANEDVVHEIMVKFDGFQKWAKGIIEKL